MASVSTPSVNEYLAPGEPLSPATWRDPKRYAWLLGLIIPTLPFLAWGLVQATGLSMLWFYGPLLVFAIFPLLDLLIGMDAANPPDSVIKWLEEDRYYRWCTYLFIPIQYAGLIFACWLWSSGTLSTVDDIGLMLTVAMVSGIAINTAHELGHKRDSIERWLSRVALAQSAYGHFFIEHNRGHHSRVATPEDPASSRLGESFWAFLPRTVVGGLRSGWGLEKGRLARHDTGPWSVHNKILQAWAMSVALFGTLIGVFGVKVVPFLVIQAVLGFSLLEVVNYLEHYGLLRQKVATGRYERCMPRHSWNSNHIASNVFLYNLDRHSDHHANPTRRYQMLRHFEEAPQLPSGYGLMLGIAYIPPLWRKVMDKRVLAMYDGDVTKANIQPSKRKKILAKYAA